MALAPANGVDLSLQPVVVAFFRPIDAHQPSHHRVDAVLLPEHCYGLIGLLRLLSEHIRSHRLLGIFPSARRHDALSTHRRTSQPAWGYCAAPAAWGHGLPAPWAELDLSSYMIAIGAHSVLIRVVNMAIGALCVAHGFPSSIMYSFAGTLQR